MTSTGGSDDAPAIDPDFAALFRPDDLVPATPAPAREPDPAPPTAAAPFDGAPAEPRAPSAAEEESAAPPSTAPHVAEPSVDTGRLFRSQGVVGRDDAVLALASDHFGRLRTLERRREGEPVVPAAVASAAAAAPSAVEELEGDDAGQQVPDRVPTPASARGSDVSEGRRMRRRAGITGGAVYLIVIGVTVLVAFANAVLSSGDLGWPTGLALLVSSVYAALTVRRQDDAVAMIVPPIAFLAASLTAGQIFLGSAEGSLLNRAVVVFFSLADNWVWIIGSTVAALVIVLVRRRRA